MQEVLSQIRPRGYKIFFMFNSTEHENFVKMPISGISTCISVSAISEILKAEKVFIFEHFR